MIMHQAWTWAAIIYGAGFATGIMVSVALNWRRNRRIDEVLDALDGEIAAVEKMMQE